MDLLIISGMSGAGKSEAVKAIEDMGYYCMDNVPSVLLPQIADLCSRSERKIEKVAVVVDIRGIGFFDKLFMTIESLKSQGINVRILFMEASDKVLLRRYKELRRPHPLNLGGLISDGIAQERLLLEEIRSRSDDVIDTSSLTKGELRNELLGILTGGELSKLTISVCSFGFKHGILSDADLIFDVRFTPNPFYIPELKSLTGESNAVQNYVLKNPITIEFVEKTLDLLKFLIPHYTNEGKTQLIVGIGCTGGQHRSVAIAAKLKELLESIGERVTLEHRDMPIR